MEGNRLPEVKPLGLERDKQVGEARNEKPRCNSNNCRCPNWCIDGTCDLIERCVSKEHFPYSSDLSVCMRLVDVSWQITVVHDYAQWRCIIKQGNTLLENGYGATPALAMIDAITRAFMEVNGET